MAKRAIRLRLRGYEARFLGFLRFYEGRLRSLVAPHKGGPADLEVMNYIVS